MNRLYLVKQINVLNAYCVLVSIIGNVIQMPSHYTISSHNPCFRQLYIEYDACPRALIPCLQLAIISIISYKMTYHSLLYLAHLSHYIGHVSDE